MNLSSSLILTLQLLLVVISTSRTSAKPNSGDVELPDPSLDDNPPGQDPPNSLSPGTSSSDGLEEEEDSDPNDDDLGPSPTFRPYSTAAPQVPEDGYVPPFNSPSSSSHSNSEQTRAIQYDAELRRRRTQQSHNAPSSISSHANQGPSSHAIASYHHEVPTHVILEFAKLRKDIKTQMTALETRSNETDARLTELINGNVSTISTERQRVAESIKNETEKRVKSLKRLHREARGWVDEVKKDIASLRTDADLVSQTGKSDKVQQEESLQTHILQTDDEIRKLSAKIHNLFTAVHALDVLNLNKER